MGRMGFLHLMIFFLGFSSLFLSCTSVPSSRSLMEIKKELTPQASAFFNDQKGRDFQKFQHVEEGYKKGRIAMDNIDDYGPTGPNPHHDPKPPGRV